MQWRRPETHQPAKTRACTYPATKKAAPPRNCYSGHCRRRSFQQSLRAVRDSAETSIDGFIGSSADRSASDHCEEAASITEATQSWEGQTSVLGSSTNGLQATY